jgi:NAD(P)-dependent dehydrogenase (short-subunit alcohol dehydrogenase family)
MNADGGQQTVHVITENGGDATFVQVDVSNTTEVEAMISKAVETYGRLDCAHNNAGVGGSRGGPSKSRAPTGRRLDICKEPGRESAQGGVLTVTGLFPSPIWTPDPSGVSGLQSPMPWA